MVPVLLGSHGKLFPPLHQEDAGVADLSGARLAQPAGQFVPLSETSFTKTSSEVKKTDVSLTQSRS